MSAPATSAPGYDPALLAPLNDDYSGLRILAVHAHPDDESSKGASSMAAYVSRGARVMVASMTGGERGDILNETVNSNPAAHRDLPGVRRQEMAQAAEILGIEHRWIGFTDSGLPEGDPLPPLPFGAFATLPLETAAAPLIRLVRDFKPHVILTYDEIGGYPHPDHIMTHRVSMEAFEKAGDADAYPGAGEPWTVSKIYYDRAFNMDRMSAFHHHLEAAGLESPFARWVAMSLEEDAEGHRPPVSRHQTTTRISSGEFFEKRDEALRAHASQVAPDSLFFAVSPAAQRDIWPFEDYVLAHSRVRTELPETCFATGIDYSK
ncbi:mycothiol conjugate amidase Mca [Rothia nasimurium]|uniref:mycothiol conjugate amidase Mca n=1 Tax=Rothia nasimurium TaxID=85336 RepID=UPI001F01DE7B|nr:mycothiol conjugate amidase Mca [Rothia nasimurium]